MYRRTAGRSTPGAGSTFRLAGAPPPAAETPLPPGRSPPVLPAPADVEDAHAAGQLPARLHVRGDGPQGEGLRLRDREHAEHVLEVEPLDAVQAGVGPDAVGHDLAQEPAAGGVRGRQLEQVAGR